MKTLRYQGQAWKLLALTAVLTTLSRSALAGDATAFQLIKEGDRYVGEGVKDQVVQIRSEKSVGSLTPNVWYVVYYDPDATFKATEVKFGAGKKMDVKRPMRMLEPMSGADQKLDSARLKIDSDKALRIATSDPLLQNIKLTSSQMWLERGDDGPIWRVRLWAQKLRDPEHDQDIGEVRLAADSGEVVRRDLHTERLN
jgi:hypothetical protein